MTDRRLLPVRRPHPLALAARAAVALWLLLVAGEGPARAGDPRLVWRTIDTPHFTINYHGELERLAQRLALVAEAAHERLVPFFDHRPRRRTQVLLTDFTDDANGLATVYPYPQISLYATAPDDRSELNDYDDWLSALVTHEYTHILHLDTIHGIARVVNAILGFGVAGQLYIPNQLQPRFIIEGLAVFEETEHTSAGRLRSTIYDMWLRGATLEGKFQRLDQFTSYPIQWPRGGSAYLYGSAFLRYIASLYGPDVFRRLSHEQGGAWLPGGINRGLRRVTGGKRSGQTFETLYAGFRETMAERYRQQLALVEASGRVEGTRLAGPREYAARPVFTRDGQSVVWADSSGYDRQQYRMVPRGGGPLRTLYRVDSPSGLAFSPDGKTLYFSAIEVFRAHYAYNDLFAVDLPSGERRQLTHGLRAENPDLSPDGRTLAFSVNQAGSRSLCTLPVDGGEPTWLVGNRDDLSQIYTPAWSPDGRTIAFSWWREGGYRDIWTVDVATRQTTRITADRALDLDPRFSPDGRYLYFSSDRTGIYNLFAYELATRRTFQVTNVLGGVFDVAISPDGRSAAYVGFAADGWTLETIALDPARFRPAAEALLDRPDADVPHGLANLPSRRYQPFRTAYPHLLNVSSYPDAFGQVLAINLSGYDLASLHSWQLGLGFSLARADDVTASFSYSYGGFIPSLAISGYRQLVRRGGFYVDGVNRAYDEEDYSLSAGIDFPVLRQVAQAADIGLNYNLVYLDNKDRNQLPLDPNLVHPVLPETGRVASLGIGASYSSLRRYTFSVSTEQGRALSVGLGVSLKGLGSQYEAYSASWHYAEYIPMPWRPEPLRNHTLILSYSGGLSGGELSRRGAYYLGGLAVQTQDILRAFFDFTRGGYGSLRGYPYASVGGTELHLLNAEYRFPIAWVQRGLGTFPFFLQRLTGALFADYGDAFSDRWRTTSLKDFKLGVGGEVRLDLAYFYYFGASLQLGYARGLSAGGIDQGYFLLNSPW